MSTDSFRLVGDKFIIEDYDRKAAFSSFLPGLAGVKGIPVWSFYTNRGQGINSFGIHNKANAMMEFNSAITGYETANLKGFRTFVRKNGEYFEPFCSSDRNTRIFQRKRADRIRGEPRSALHRGVHDPAAREHRCTGA